MYLTAGEILSPEIAPTCCTNVKCVKVSIKELQIFLPKVVQKLEEIAVIRQKHIKMQLKSKAAVK